MKFMTASLAVMALAVAAAAAMAQPYGGGYGPMMGGYGMGYGMGPGMMGGYGMGGMMMGARNSACNPDGSVPNFGFRRNVGALNLSADDVKNYVQSSLAWNGNPNLKLGTVKEVNDDTINAQIVTKDNSLVEELAFDRHTGFSCFVTAAK